jgi:hypothetical protein
VFPGRVAASSRNLSHHSDATLTAAFRATEREFGRGTIGIDEIRTLLSIVYKGVPPEREVGMFIAQCDLQARGPQLPGGGAEGGILVRVSLSDFLRVAASIRTTVEEAEASKTKLKVTSAASEFSSKDSYDTVLHKHARTKYPPQEKFITPMCSSHEIGWFAPAKVELADRRPNKSCPETIFASKFHAMS